MANTKKVKRSKRLAQKIIKSVNPTAAKAVKKRAKRMAAIDKELSKKKKKRSNSQICINMIMLTLVKLIAAYSLGFITCLVISVYLDGKEDPDIIRGDYFTRHRDDRNDL